MVAAAIPSAVAAGAAIEGAARAIDGDSLMVAGVEIRLAGMDAFEWNQNCGDFACGAAATARLRSAIAGEVVSCIARGRSYDRTVAVCRAGGRDLGAALVAAGLALDSPRYGPDYGAAEAAAAKARRGAWAHRFMKPWDWRRR